MKGCTIIRFQKCFLFTTTPLKVWWFTANAIILLLIFAGCGGGGSSKTDEGGPSTNAPLAPSNLSATALSERQIELTWQDNSTNEINFKIYRCEGSGCNPQGLRGRTGSNTENFKDTSAYEQDQLYGGTTYCYTVCSSNRKGKNCSNISCAKTATILANKLVDAFSPQIAISANGNAVAVWQQDVEKDFYTLYTLYYRIYNASTGKWVNKMDYIINIKEDNIFNPRVAMDSEGNAVAVWQQNSRVCAKRYVATTDSWEQITSDNTIDDGSGFAAETLQIAMDPQGNAMVVWQQNSTIYARYFSANSWGPITPLSDSNSGDAETPQIAMDPQGNAIAVWQQNSTIYARYFSANSWGPITPLSDSNSGDAETPQVAMDPQGNAMVVWKQLNEDFVLNIYARRYNAASNIWGPVETVDTGAEDAENPQIAMDSQGNAIIVWQQFDKNFFLNIYARRYNAASNIWDSVKTVDAGSEGAENPQIAMDSQGNAIAVWMQGDFIYSIYGNKYNVISNRWTGAANIQVGTGEAYNPQVVMNLDGKAIAVWEQYDNEDAYTNIYSNIFE